MSLWNDTLLTIQVHFDGFDFSKLNITFVSPDVILCGWLGLKHQPTNYYVCDSEVKTGGTTSLVSNLAQELSAILM